MEKELLFEDTKFIKARKLEIEKKVFAINTVLNSLLEQLGCVLSDEEVGQFLHKPDSLFQIVCCNLIKPYDVRVDVIKETIQEKLEPISRGYHLMTRSLDVGSKYILIKDGCAAINEEKFEEDMNVHRTMLDSEPRRKAWTMAQQIVADIAKLEKFLAENTAGRLQPHAIGQNTIYAKSCLISYYEGNVKLEPRAINCIK